MHLDVLEMGKTSVKKHTHTAEWKQIPGRVQQKLVTKQRTARLSKSSPLAILQLT